jgi:D-glycero-D-manno-heptose 1,7-bisphosphate phosphatase
MLGKRSKLVLLDRDGVINEDRADFVKTPEELIFIPGALEAIARLTQAGFKTAIVTNQSCIGRGIATEEQIEKIHTLICAAVAAAGGSIDAVFCCPDAPDAATRYRKPGSGMLEDALELFGAKAAQSPLVGDALRDLQAAAALGCPRYLVRTGKGEATLSAGLPKEVAPVTVTENLSTAVEDILQRFT